MYPEGELNSLARRKAGLRKSISRHRAECIEAVATASRPLAWIDVAYSLWRTVAPLVKLGAWPLGAAALRGLFPGQKILRFLIRWAPAAFSAFSVFKRMRKTSSARK